MTDEIRVHVIRTDIKSGAVIKKYMARYVPRIGDEIRLDEHTFYKVTHVVWCLDEEYSPTERVNIGVSLVKRKTK